MAHVYCPECGYNNPESAHFCAKCGAALVVPEEGESTEAFAAPEVPESLDPIDDLGIHGAALIVRSGGGRSGESFTVDEERMSIGRTPDAAVFLDDVTVSRNHALLVRRQDGYYIDDLGSLNGTYVNRRRIESHRLTDGDEIQIGKYKLSYLER
jgi:hypothetical protein